MILCLSSFLWWWILKLCMAGFWMVLDSLIICAFVTLPCSFYCEMLDIDPNCLKFCMMLLDMLLDLWGLIVHFSHLPFLFYGHVCMVWQFVSHIWLINLCNLISISNDLCWSWFFVWWLYWMCWMLMNFSRIIWIISVLI